MARFGSFGGGLSAGLSAGLDRQGADMDRQYKGLLQRYQMSQAGLEKFGNILIKYKENGQEPPPELVQLVKTLAKQADEFGVKLGQPEAGVNTHTMEALLGAPGPKKTRGEPVAIYNADGTLIGYEEKGSEDLWSALEGGESSHLQDKDDPDTLGRASSQAYLKADLPQSSDLGDRYKVIPGQGVYDLQELKFVKMFDDDNVKIGDGLWNPNTQEWLVEKSAKYDHIKPMGGGLYDVKNNKWVQKPQAGTDHLKPVQGGLWNVNTKGWEVEPKGDYSHIKSVGGGLYDIKAKSWLQKPAEGLGHLKTVQGGIWNVNDQKWEVKPKGDFSHIKSVGGGLYDVNTNKWVQKPPEKLDHLKSVGGGLWNANTSEWEVEPKGDYSHIKPVQGGLRDVKNDAWIVEPKAEGEPAYSQIVLHNPNPPEGESSWKTFDKNTQQKEIKDYSNRGWDATTRGVVSPTPGGLTGETSETKAERDRLRGRKDQYLRARRLIGLVREMHERDPLTLGAAGGVQQWFSKKLGGLASIAALVGPGRMQDFVNNTRQWVATETEMGNMDPAIMDQYFSDTAVTKNDLDLLDLYHHSMAAIVARSRQPTDRILASMLKKALEDTNLIGLQHPDRVMNIYEALDRDFEYQIDTIDGRLGERGESTGPVTQRLFFDASGNVVGEEGG